MSSTNLEEVLGPILLMSYLETFIQLATFVNVMHSGGESCESYNMLQIVGHTSVSKGIKQLLGCMQFGHL